MPNGTGVFLVGVEGIPEVEAALIELGAVKVPRAIGRSLAKGGQILKAAMKAEAQSSFVGQSKTNPGGLLRGITYRSTGKVGNEHVVVGPIWGPGTFHRHLVIDGHNIQHRKGGPILGRTRANDFVARAEVAAGEAAVAAVEAQFVIALDETP